MPIENEQVIIDQTIRRDAIRHFRLEHNKIEFPHSFKCEIERFGACKNCNLQNVHTPFDLCYEMVGKLKEFAGDLGNKDILAFNLEFVETLVYNYGVSKERIWFLTDCKAKAILCVQLYKGVNVVSKDFFDFLGDKKQPRKFDVVIMNPPYQAPTNNKGSGHTLWDKFVEKALELTKDGGHFVSIHPSGWRSGGDSTKNIKSLMIGNHFLYLEIHNESDGLKTFGATTRYDWYVLRKVNSNELTVVVDEDGVAQTVNLNEMQIIPNKQFQLFLKMMASSGDKKCGVVYSRSAYGADKPHISKEKTSLHKYPVIYSVGVNGPTIYYSSINSNGHFGIPKVIVNPNRPVGCLVDQSGEYGLTQWCIGITGTPKHLEMVASVIKNQKTNGFGEFMKAFHFSNEILNRNVLMELRHDFWKEFVDAKGNELP